MLDLDVVFRFSMDRALLEVLGDLDGLEE